MRNTGLSSSIGLIAVGAILAWAVTFETEAVDVNKVGLILFGVGILGVVVTMAMTATSQKTVIERNREVLVGNEQVVAQTHPQQQVQQQVQQPVQAQPQAQQFVETVNQ